MQFVLHVYIVVNMVICFDMKTDKEKKLQKFDS